MPNKEIKQLVRIPIDSLTLFGDLVIPPQTRGLVIFAHGSGSGRQSPRNVYVAEAINKKGIGTLLFDLLTEEEDLIYENRFNIPLLAQRLKAVTKWLKSQKQFKDLKIGYFGASTGAAAALIAAADLGEEIKAVVSRGGRPDLALDYLEKVKAPTLLLVGSHDYGVIELNEEALEKIKAEKKLSLIPGATHLFEEPGALEEVARQATEWFLKYL